MGLFHRLKSLTIDDIKIEMANFLAVCTYADSIVRSKELNKSYELLDELFDGEDYDFLKDEFDLLLQKFQENSEEFVKAKFKAVQFAVKNKKKRKDLIQIARLVFQSDFEVNRNEEELLETITAKGNKYDKKGEDND